jgi:hypothetical protein
MPGTPQVYRGQRCVSIFVSDGNHQREVSSEPLHLVASVRSR